MEIGDWKATAELNVLYRRARELGLETNLAELEAFGFTVVEPEKVGALGLSDRMLEAALSILEREDAGTVDLQTRPQDERPVFGRTLFHILEKDPVFAEALMHPVTLTLGRYLTGASAQLYNTTALVKRGPAGVTRMHTDSVGVPPPLPAAAAVANVSWVLTDYRRDSGTFYMVPGSHRMYRHPTPMDYPSFMSGPADDELGIPVEAPPGSLIVFSGNTWHGTYPKTDDALRVHVVYMFCRNYVSPGERQDAIPHEVVQRYGPEFARLIGRDAWQGYGSEGPRIENLAKVQRAHVSPAA